MGLAEYPRAFTLTLERAERAEASRPLLVGRAPFVAGPGERRAVPMSDPVERALPCEREGCPTPPFGGERDADMLGRAHRSNDGPVADGRGGELPCARARSLQLHSNSGARKSTPRRETGVSSPGGAGRVGFPATHSLERDEDEKVGRFRPTTAARGRRGVATAENADGLCQAAEGRMLAASTQTGRHRRSGPPPAPEGQAPMRRRGYSPLLTSRALPSVPTTGRESA